jgi:hypothetical protein
VNFTLSDGQIGQTVRVSLSDVTGRLIREEALGDGLQWNTDNLPPGIYLATFTSGKRRVTVKLVK